MLALKTSLFHSEVYIALISFNQKLKRQNALSLFTKVLLLTTCLRVFT